MSDQVLEDIKKKILRERNIITATTTLKKKTNNADVIQKCNSNIQEAQQNIDYLNERLNQLKFQNAQNTSPGAYDHSRNSNDNNIINNQITHSISNDLSSNTSNPSPTAPGFQRRANPTSAEPKYSRLDLMKYDCPSLGQRIQFMINQLDTKLKVEQKYYEANEKLSKIYQLDGDRRISSVAEDGRIQSNHKIQLLKKSLKRYEDLNVVNFEDPPTIQEDDPMNNIKFRRKPLAGTLTIGINSIRDVDHIASPLFSRKTESFISIKVDDEERAKTKGSRSDRWNEEFNIHIEKGNEVEITVYDKIGSSFVPVAIAWFLVSDIAEEIRKKKVGQSGNTGWVSASRIQNGPNLHSMQNPNTLDNFTQNQHQLQQSSSLQSINNAASTPASTNNPNINENSKQPVMTSSWFILEPSGQILITLGFTKSSTQSKRTLLGGLHRNGAIRKRDEEVFEQHGHQFVQKQFYSIMRCALCGDFLPYNGYQCQDCKFLCHKRCYEKVITKCISKSSNDLDPDELKLNHRIPHRFDHVSNRGTNWCCHCGSILPWGRKNVLKCSECDTMCHPQCSHLVPDFCGMSMETANEILNTIKSTEDTRKRQVQNFNNRQSANSSTTAVDSTNSLQQQPTNIQPASKIVPSGSSGLTTTTSSSSPEYIPTQHHRQRRPPPSDQDSLLHEQQSKPLPVPSLQEQQQQQHQREQELYHQQQQELYKEEQRRRVEEQRLAQERQYAEEARRQLVEEEELLRQQHEQNELQRQHQAYLQQADLSFQPDVDDSTSSFKEQDRRSQHASYESPISSTFNHSPQSQVPKASQAVSQPQPHQQLQQQREKHRRPKVGLDDFNFIAVLGRGNFGKVMLGRSHRSKKLCAVKILKKDMIIDNGEISSMQAEKDVFLIANREQHPFLINLHCCFQTANRIYFVMEYVSGGDLMWHVQQGNFSLRRAKFYAAEVLLALKYLHENGIVYRDLKLDNILLSTEGHIKIADYGLCKPDMWYSKTTNTFCGTPEFMAPEILKEQNYTRSVDWWAFGVLVYQMLLGKSPFRGDDEDEVFNAILTDEPLFPIQMASEAVGLLESLLDKNPQTRLGSGPKDAEEIMAHPYFKNINFDDILNLRVPPPYIPEVKSEEDVSFFDKDFTTEVPRLTPVNSVLDASSQAQFRGFSYVNDASGL